ncbi:MAG: hypothetical protein OHK0046_47230 [Anaerolineae bacterium]
MAINAFIPVIWAGTLMQEMETRLVYTQPQVCNRNWEGTIADQGDTVKIVEIGDVSVKTYTKNADLDSPEELITADMELKIDQGDYINFAVDDVDAVQANGDLRAEAMRRSSYGLVKKADSWMASLMASSIGKDNTIGTTASPKADLGTVSKAYDYLSDLSVILDENDTPEEGRFVIVPSWFHGILRKDDRFVGTGSGQADATLRNGMVGQAAGFMIYKSNQVPNTAKEKFRIIAGHNMATTYADQISKMEAYRPEKRFAEAVKGLHVYGGKVIRPQMLAMLIANQPAS